MKNVLRCSFEGYLYNPDVGFRLCSRCNDSHHDGTEYPECETLRQANLCFPNLSLSSLVNFGTASFPIVRFTL